MTAQLPLVPNQLLSHIPFSRLAPHTRSDVKSSVHSTNDTAAQNMIITLAHATDQQAPQCSLPFPGNTHQMPCESSRVQKIGGPYLQAGQVSLGQSRCGIHTVHDTST